MNFEQARFNMVEQQIRPWDVLDTSILDLLFHVKREDFVGTDKRALAFVDTQLPLDNGCTMLEPKVEARLVQDLQVKASDKVLEIGTGSGYMAALLAHKARHVTSVEIVPQLKTLAEQNLAANGVTNVTVELGDGAQGWSKGAPYDVIVVSGALSVLPEALLQQVKVGGRILAIIGEAPIMSAHLITRSSDKAYDTRKLFETNVTPLQAVAPSHFQF